MFFDPEKCRVFVYRGQIDMRCGFERLHGIIREEMKQEVLEGHLYLFLGRNRRRAKVLFFDRTGLMLIVKRMEDGMLMDAENLGETTEISLRDLSLIIAGAKVRYPTKKSA